MATNPGLRYEEFRSGTTARQIKDRSGRNCPPATPPRDSFALGLTQCPHDLDKWTACGLVISTLAWFKKARFGVARPESSKGVSAATPRPSRTQGVPPTFEPCPQ